MILNGITTAEKIRDQIRDEITNTSADRIPCLAVVLVGDNPASRIYVDHKKVDCNLCNIRSLVYHMPENSELNDVCDLVTRLSNDDLVDGVLVQLPLPKHLDKDTIISCINPKKDVDCFTYQNTGLLYQGRPYLTPCTPTGIISLLDNYDIKLEGKHCVIIGRSNIVGRPAAEMMLQRNATVTICHTRTAGLYDITNTADILISAVGIPCFVKSDMIRVGTIVIDVGMNRGPDGKLTGDCTKDVYAKASAYTPVPGGVGPMTRAMLMKNVVKAKDDKVRL